LTQFHSEAVELQDWLAERIREPGSDKERLVQLRLADALQQYLLASELLHERHGFLTSTRKRVDETNQALEQSGAPIFGLCEELMQTQRETLRAFLNQSQRTLDGLRRSISLSLVLLLLLAITVAVLVYRGMIAPLRIQLSESNALIARQEKLAALGGFAAGVAHEIRNPLTAIKFRLFNIQKALPAAFTANKDVILIGDEIHRLDRIVRDFLEFARPSDPEISRVTAQRLLQEVSQLMRPQLEEASVRLQVADTNGLWLHIDFQQIKQVLINLIRNAAESMDGAGTITLRAFTDSMPLAGKQVPAMVIEVADTGRGITAEVSRRLFDPFFTTKEGGTGLGLSIAARILEKHGGALQYETQLHRGTTFKLVIPNHRSHECAPPAN
jgi:signal transduction histidine kinase